MKLHYAIAAMLVVAACATPYRPPGERAPDQWYGAAGLCIDPTQAISAPLEAIGLNQVALRIPLIPARTGRLETTITYRGPFGGDKIIPAGTLLMTQQYSMMSRQTYNYMPVGRAVNLNASNDPVEWCTIQESEPGATCIFWEGPDRARYIPVAAMGVLMQPVMSAGMPGPMPQIREEQTPLAQALAREFVVASMDGTSVMLSVRLRYGETTLPENRMAVPVALGGQAHIAIGNRAVRLSRGLEDEDSVRVEILDGEITPAPALEGVK